MGVRAGGRCRRNHVRCGEWPYEPRLGNVTQTEQTEQAAARAADMEHGVDAAEYLAPVALLFGCVDITGSRRASPLVGHLYLHLTFKLDTIERHE
jgi:hypothetical protein